MEKDKTICFQTTAEIKNAVEKIAEEEKLGVPSVVESIVYHYLKDNRGFKTIYLEHRRFDRKKAGLPAFIGAPEWQRRDFKAGTILDISMEGIRFSVPKGTELEIKEDCNDAKFIIIFTLPEDYWSIQVKFVPKRVYQSDEEIQVGATFVNPDFHAYTSLQKYMM